MDHWNQVFHTLQITGLSFLFVFTGFLPASAQYFGRNKVVYENLNFVVKETPNYELYHYLEDDDEATRFAQLSERWHERINTVFADTFPRGFVPLILYNNHADFQQTVVIDQLIGVGVGGVTEAFRNRVVMPFNHSNRNTDHVLGHELVHTFQFNLFQTEGIGLRRGMQVPLWLVEGQAEYISRGRQDSETAMWMRDAVISDDIPTFTDMTRNPQRYFPYRFGHAALAFLTSEFGDDKLRPLLAGAATMGVNGGMTEVFGMGSDTLSTLWAERLREAYLPFTEDTTAAMGRNLFHPGNAGRLNTAPQLSPDGSQMVFISDRDVLEIEYFLADVETGEIEDRLGSQIRDMHVDFLSFMESAGTWSPDGTRLAATVFQGGINRLIITDLERGRTVRNIRFPGLKAFNNPAWSPDGRYIVVSGLHEGSSDLWLYDLEERSVRQLTDDPWSALQPAWSPDGRYIVFVSDHGEDADLEQIIYGSYKLTIYDLETGETDILDVFPGADNMNPVFGPDGNSIYFLSDADGFRNLYEYDLRNEEVFRLTRLFTGISGITMLSPAFSMSLEGDIAYSYYRGGAYSIFAAHIDDFPREQLDPRRIDQRAAQIPPFEDPPVNLVQIALQSYPLTDTGRFEDMPFNPRFRLERIGSSGIGVGFNQYGVGAAGGISGIFNDILREHTLFTAFQLNGRLIDAGGQVAYFSRARRLNWGLSASHIPYRNMGAFLTEDQLNGQPVLNLQFLEERMFETQLGLFTYYPFTTNYRVELGVTGTRYGFRRDIVHNFYTPAGFFIDQERERVDAPEPLYLAQVNLAYVGDTSIFGATSPLSGSRYRFELSSTLGDLEFFTALADHRSYVRAAPFTFAFRGYHFGRYGRDSDALFPLYAGSPFLIRGYSIRSFLANPQPGNASLNVNNLFGDKLAVANAEIRLPFTGPEQLAVITSRFFFTDLVLFADGGIAWTDRDAVRFRWEADPDPEIRTPVFSAGASVRINLFGYMVVEPYFAVPFQRDDVDTMFGLFFSGGGW